MRRLSPAVTPSPKPASASVKLFRHSLPVHFLPSTNREHIMQILPSLPPGATSSHPTPVGIWQTLLSHLLQQHYGLMLNDTRLLTTASLSSISTPASPCAMR
ncbi:toxin of the YeeV-YeeU toxin-antitoxin system [Salmonella enterica subsp. enterica serovar Gallinarum]|nr:toxin of the YeeV-YeeU toxin-antitoxin system [Salmonella enterica subsp. enterica serovar Gallinarum]